MSIKLITMGLNGENTKLFPKLMELTYSGPRSGTLVVFHKEKCGFVVRGNGEYKETNLYNDHWNMAYFVDYNEPITIQNS